MIMVIKCFFAQAGSEAAGQIIEQSLELQKDIYQSWNSMWDNVIVLDAPPDIAQTSLWAAMCYGATFLAALILIYSFIKSGSEILRRRHWAAVVEMFIWPITVVVFLGGDGRLLAAAVLVMRGSFEYIIRQVQRVQLAGIQVQTAVEQIQMNTLGIIRVKQLLNECEGVVGADAIQCFESKADEIQSISQFIDAISPDINTGALDFFIDTVINMTVIGQFDIDGVDGVGEHIGRGFLSVIEPVFFPILRVILFALQWAFTDSIEAALILTAVLAPFALALSLLPVSGKPIWAWASTFFGLYAIKISYILLLGVVATVLVNTEGDFAEIFSDYGFAFFAAIFSPSIATALGKGGGTAIYQAINKHSADVLSFLGSAISTLLTK